MDDLVVDSKLATTVVDDHDPDTAPAISKGIAELVPKRALVNDGQRLDDIARLGHCNDATLVNVKDAILLENGTEHRLNINRRRRVAHEARLLLKLLGKEVNTQVTVLASLGRGGDADDLARTALEHDKVSNADVMAGDGDGARSNAAWAFNKAVAFTAALVVALAWRLVTLDANLLTIVVTATVDRVQEAIGGTLYAAAEGVVAAIVIVVAHLGFLLVVDLPFCLNVDVLPRCSALVLDVVGGTLTTLEVCFVLCSLGCATLVLYVVGWALETTTVFAFGDVDVSLSSRLAFTLTLDVDIDLCATGGFTVAVKKS